MTLAIHWSPPDALPGNETVLEAMGLPDAAAASARTRHVVEEACRIFLRLATPRAVARDIDRETFSRVFPGRGDNDPRTPLGTIYPRADALALFVATVGPAVSDEIARRFAGNDLALAYALDTVASEAADGLATRVANAVEAHARARADIAPGSRALPYSPGYCGWHVSGQAALFAELRPEATTGVTLNDSFLMQPLKSVSGVVVVAPKAVHDVPTDFDCCDVCSTRHCQQRVAAL